MKGKSTYPITAFLLAIILCAVSCIQEEIFEPQQTKAAFAIVGNPVEVHLGITVNGLAVGVGTRAEMPTDGADVEDTDEERHVDDLWIFEYSASTGKLIYPPTYRRIYGQEELADINVTLSDNKGNPVTIYVVANSGSGVEEDSEEWVVEETIGTDITYTGFMTVEELEANALPTPHPQRMIWDGEKYVIQYYDEAIVGNISIPMSGSVEETVKEGAEILVPVDRMYAKLLIAVDASDFDDHDDQDVSLYALSIGNIPEYCRVGTLWDGNKSDYAEMADYSECNQWISRRFTGDGMADDFVSNDQPDYPYNYIIYLPENIQGENDTGDSGKADNAPISEGSTSTRALNIEASINVTLEDGSVVGPYTYTAYPGGNTKTNFNVRRNCVYRVKLKVNYPIALNPIPSANCIVCLSGQTTAFFPYCREEMGGGYDFTDYLDASDDGTKKIDHVGIIWQSTNANSNSGTGFIGDNSGGKLVWIDNLENGDAESEYQRMIHVTIPDGNTGNALVGAYNSRDEIIWSWHIWARTPDTDPTAVNTKLYYTYEWDENGIYGKDSGHARVMGYTIMNSNLGAMQDDPSGPVTTFSNVVPTFGLQYEWGRKDPFPSYYKSEGSTDDGVFAPYSEYVQDYYDNENRKVAFADYARTSANELFYSLPGNERPDNFYDAIRQSIQNPTAYLCGSNEARAYNGPDLGVSTSDTTVHDEERREALEANFPYPHDGNWLHDEESDHQNRLWGGLDPELDSISKSFDTGYKSFLGDVHLYDDYGEKSIFDPCPYGWRVSPPDLWLGFTDTGLNPADLTHVNYSEDNSGTYGMYMYMTAWRTGETSFFPTQGTRQPNGGAYKIARCGNYHNATADSGGRVNIMHVHFNNTSFNIFEYTTTAYYLKSVASPVRCVRFSSVQQ